MDVARCIRCNVFGQSTAPGPTSLSLSGYAATASGQKPGVIQPASVWPGDLPVSAPASAPPMTGNETRGRKPTKELNKRPNSR